MAVDFTDFVLHTKAGGQVIKKYRCTCDECGSDRGYLPKSKAFKLCLPCVSTSPDYRNKLKISIKAARSTEESRQKTIDANAIRWAEVRKQAAEAKILKDKNPRWWRTDEWRKNVSKGLKGKPSPNKGKTSSLETRIKSSCTKRGISISEFTSFADKSIQAKLKHSMSSRLGHMLKKRGSSKTRSITKSLPYSIEDLKKHLESKFQEGMSWDNYGRNGWHIDHKTPDNWFTYFSENDEDFKKSWALNNLQPLWETENCSKQDRYEG